MRGVVPESQNEAIAATIEDVDRGIVLREVARQLPLDRLLIETDCPYLTPVPFRGKRNEPARVVETARCLAGLHARELAEVGRVTSENFAKLFGVRLHGADVTEPGAVATGPGYAVVPTA